jgi:Mannosyl-glycoprotein endo-beta-N-acetylglucosaminidase
MTLLNELVSKYAVTNLNAIFSSPSISNSVDLKKIDSELYEQLREVNLAQWLLESARGNSDLAKTTKNFSGLKWRKEMAPFASAISILVPSEPVPVEFCQFKDVDAFITGYWKFLTRSPYAGIVEHTNTPENFLGFLQRQGFSSDMEYVGKVIKLIPEARNLLAEARGITIAPPPNDLQVVAFSQEVEVSQGFTIEGTAPINSSGQNITVTIDGNFTPPGPTVGSNGKWVMNFVFNQAGDRKMKFTLGNQIKEILIKVSPAVDDIGDQDVAPPGSVTINLTGNVGAGGVNNPPEVIAVKKRLHSLGYTWVGDLNNASITTGFITAIKLFQSIIAGNSNVAGDGRIDVGGVTHRWLQAKNAPIWQLMPNSDTSINFVNFERQQTNDNHDFGTSWLHDAILKIARDYHASSPNSAPFTINDVSLPHGGDTPDHHGHETGLMCDVNLPRTNGKSGGITWSSGDFDQKATRILIKSMRKHLLVRTVLFNDPGLRNEGLCNFAGGHDNHIHFEINPPVKQ